ncbi:MAG: HNH endonuclease, partial [Planktothrix agardhii]
KPTSLGGKDTYDNLQLLHKHCHDIKTAHDGSLTKNKVNPLEQVENYDLNPF